MLISSRIREAVTYPGQVEGGGTNSTRAIQPACFVLAVFLLLTHILARAWAYISPLGHWHPSCQRTCAPFGCFALTLRVRNVPAKQQLPASARPACSTGCRLVRLGQPCSSASGKTSRFAVSPLLTVSSRLRTKQHKGKECPADSEALASALFVAPHLANPADTELRMFLTLTLT